MCVVMWTKIENLCFYTADCSDKETVEDRQTDMRCESRYVIKMFLSPASLVLPISRIYSSSNVSNC